MLDSALTGQDQKNITARNREARDRSQKHIKIRLVSLVSAVRTLHF